MGLPQLKVVMSEDIATDAEALHHLLQALRDRAEHGDDALARGAVKHLTRLEREVKDRADYIDDAGHRYTDCEAGNCRCGYAELKVWP